MRTIGKVRKGSKNRGKFFLYYKTFKIITLVFFFLLRRICNGKYLKGKLPSHRTAT